MYIHERSKHDRQNIKIMTDDFDIFNEKLTEKIDDICNVFFGLNDVTTDDEEW